jgi:predicted ribosomally synthesized peptide with SipW-like signal peptide
MDQPVRRTRRTRLLFLGVFALAALSVGSATTSLALFTDQEAVDATFTSGTITLDAAKVDALSFATGTMVPGDAKTGAVVVENDGDHQLRYDLTATATDASSPNGPELSTALTVEVRGVDVDLAGCGSFDGAVVQASEVLGASNALGAGNRVLDATANETLCIRVALPLATDNTFQGAESVVTFTFDAEQTANN